MKERKSGKKKRSNKEMVSKIKGKKPFLVASQTSKCVQPSACSPVEQVVAPSYLPTITVFYVKMHSRSSWVLPAYDAVIVAALTGKVLHGWFIAKLSANTVKSPVV